MLDKVLNTCNYVHKNSKHVQIDESKLKNLTHQFNFEKPKHWLLTNPFGILDLDVESIINFLVIFDSIDFSFWGNPKWSVEFEKKSIDGSYALMYCLLELQRKFGNLNFDYISFDDFNNSLNGNVEIPLLKRRYEIAKDVSKIINEKMHDNFYLYIQNVTVDTELFNIIISNFPSFVDTRTYRDKTIYFYKLAQLLTSDILHIRNFKENICVDVSHLIACADYKIPQVLRNLGILVFDEELANLVDNKIELLENSEYETEIRANMVIAINNLKSFFNESFSSIEINDLVWSLGQDKSLMKLPYHLTRTTSY